MALVTWAFVALVLLLVIALLLVKVTRGTTAPLAPEVASAPSAVVYAATAIPTSVFDTVGAPDPSASGPVALSGQPPLTISGLPAVVFVGAEFCPYCAAERWALVAALGRFGSFTRLGATSSSAQEAFPSTPAFSFDDSSFRSRHVAFLAVEAYAGSLSMTAPAGFPRLHQLTPLESAVVRRYDTAPFVSGSSTLPFVDIGNRYIVSGAGVGFSPGVLQGISMSQIASGFSDATNPATQAILSEANGLAAAICQVTGERPAPVCSSWGVRAGSHWLDAPRSTGAG
jgi:hypothetical protein